MNTRKIIQFMVIILCMFISITAFSEYEVGLRFDGNLGSGKPANDILVCSFVGQWRYSENYLLGVALEKADNYDIDEPNNNLELQSNEVVDASANNTMYSIWIERRFAEHDNGSFWYITGGLGLNTIDVGNFYAITSTGQPYEIAFKVENEWAVTATAGWRYKIGSPALGLGIRLEYHEGEWL